MSKKMKYIEHMMVTNNEGMNMAEIQRLKDEVNEVLLQDELHWRQRSRGIWLEAGDKNTKFFHYKASQRSKKNYIGGLMESHSHWRSEEAVVVKDIEDYFTNIFTSDNP